MATIRACLASLGVASADVFSGCAGVAEEFVVVKRCYIRLALTSHPDKGGDVEHFREVQEAWEALRTTFERCFSAAVASCDKLLRRPGSGKVDPAGFGLYLGASKDASAMASAPTSRGPVPSYEWYATAAEEDIPSYIVEHAKTGRSSVRSVWRFRPFWRT